MDSAIDYTNMFEGRCALIYVIDVLEDYRVMLNTDNNYWYINNNISYILVGGRWFW